MTSSFQNRLAEAIRIRGIKPADLSKKTGLSKAQISQYVNGIYEAKQKPLYKLATALNVSPVWLMGYDVPIQGKEQPNPQEMLEQFYDKETLDALSMFLTLDKVDRAKIVERMQVLLEDEKYSVQEELKNA